MFFVHLDIVEGTLFSSLETCLTHGLISLFASARLFIFFRASFTSPLNGDVHDAVFIDFGGVDIYLNDFRLFAELGEFPRDSVIEAHAESDYQIRMVDGDIGIDGTVHAQHSQ